MHDRNRELHVPRWEEEQNRMGAKAREISRQWSSGKGLTAILWGRAVFLKAVRTSQEFETREHRCLT